jgi:RNA polymerase sigma factor (TIGR02999 family)
MNRRFVLPSHASGGKLGRGRREVVPCQSERKTQRQTRHEPAPPPDALDALRSGRRESLDELTVLLYKELREIAHRHRAGDPALATTTLVHEAYLKLVDQSRASWNDRAHFLALAAVVMRHILTDRARARMAAKRGGAADVVTFDEHTVASEDRPDALLQIHEALDRLAAIDERVARVVEYSFFGGLTHEEIAAALGVTERTVERDWAKARVLLRDLLTA